jgi:hypothetical protein
VHIDAGVLPYHNLNTTVVGNSPDILLQVFRLEL